MGRGLPLPYPSPGPPPPWPVDTLLPSARPRPSQSQPRYLSRGCLNFEQILTPSWEPIWAISGPIWEPKLAHLGLIFGSCSRLLFDILSEANFYSIRERFEAQIGSRNQPKTWEGCQKSAFSPLRFGAGCGGLPGAVLEPIWASKLSLNRSQDAFRQDPENDTRKGPPKEPKMSPQPPPLDPPKRAQDGPKTAPRPPKDPPQTHLDPPSTPKSPQDLPKTRKMRKNGPKTTHLGAILDRFFDMFQPPNDGGSKVGKCSKGLTISPKMAWSGIVQGHTRANIEKKKETKNKKKGLLCYSPRQDLQ